MGASKRMQADTTTDTGQLEEVERLAVAAAGGCSDALGALYERYVDPVYRYVHVRTRDHAKTEDICSEVWVKVVRGIRGYQQRAGGFPAWLFTIARTTSADHYRAADRRPETPTADMLHFYCPSMDVGPEEATLRTEVAEQLAKALRKLSKPQAQCLTLRFFHGLSIAETASVMGTTIGAVKQQQLRAMRHLAAVLPEEIRSLGAAVNVTHLQVQERPMAVARTTQP